jgi:uncharacterized protein (TIGR02147 family)
MTRYFPFQIPETLCFTKGCLVFEFFVDSVSMIEQLAIQKILREEFARAKAKNPSYSVRAFAKRLQVSSATISQLLNGKRKASSRLARKVADRLTLGPKDQSALMSLFDEKKKVGDVADRREPLELEADQFQLIADWHHFAILSLLETENCKSDSAWIARRLGLPQRIVQSGIERLLRLELIVLEGGSYRIVNSSCNTSDDIPNAAIRKHLLEYLQLAARSLESEPIDRRDLTSLCMAIDKSKLPEAKKLIRDFRARLCLFLESGKKTSVYNLSISLFPLTTEEP